MPQWFCIFSWLKGLASGGSSQLSFWIWDGLPSPIASHTFFCWSLTPKVRTQFGSILGGQFSLRWGGSSVQSLSHVWLFATPWTAARQASLSITNSQSLLKLMSIESVIPFNHLILCHPLLLPPSIFPSIKVFSSESVLCIRWPKYWPASASVLPMNIQDWFP